MALLEFPLLSNRPPLRTAIALVALGWSLLGCGPGAPSDPIAAAREQLAKGDSATALIQLKSALQKSPDSAEARFLMGRALLQHGDPAGAATELGKAVAAGHDRNEAVPLLARAELQAFRIREVARTYASMQLDQPAAQAELKALVAQAQTALRETDAARANAQEAMKLDPRNATARLVMARLSAADGRFDEALKLTAGALADHPRSGDAWQLQGDLYWLGKGDLKQAEAAYLKALEVEPRRVDGHAALAMLALTRNDVEGFRKRVAAMKQTIPGALITRLHEAELSVIDKDLKRAREQVQQLMRVAPDHERVLQLAGVLEIEARQIGQAQAHLQKAIQVNPNLPYARLLLAETYVRAGDSPRGLQLLEPLLAQPKPASEALALAGEAYIQLGDLPTAEGLFQRAATQKPEDPRVGSALALSMIARGRAEEGFAKLAALSKTKDGSTAMLALVSTRLSRGQTDEALQAVRDYRTQNAELPLPWLLEGRILRARNDAPGARKAFEKALSLDAKYFPAVTDLVELDMREKRPQDATQRLKAFLAANPKHADAMVALALQAKRAGDPPPEVTRILTQAIEADPAATSPRLALVEHYLSISNLDGALSTAQEASARFPSDLVVTDSLGRVQLARGDLQQALSSFGKIAAARPRSVPAQVRMAEVERRSKRFQTAQDRLLSALTLAPDSTEAQDTLLAMALRDGRGDSVLQAAQELQKRQPKHPVGWAIEGAVLSARKQWPGAIAAFSTAVDRAPARVDLALRLHAMYAAAGRNADAQRFAARWEAANPKNVVFLQHQGMMAINAKDYALAETKFRAAQALKPEDPQILNNLAWTLLQRGQSGALALAEKANAAIPDTPLFMDTLASALAQEGQLPRALQLQRRAVERAPDDYGLRLNLARLLVKSGEREAAKTELVRLQALGSRFEGQPEVQALLKTTGS